MLFTKANNQLATISYVSSGNITTENEITIQGTGFSAQSCQNQIIIGGVDCPILSTSTTELTCKLSDNSGLYPNIPQLI